MESPGLMVEAADRLEKVDIFESVDVFRAGTFKFERNVHYTKNIAEFEGEMMEAHMNQATQKTSSQTQRQLSAKHHVEKMKQEYKPHLKHLKTYVPIFPTLYENLESGHKLAARKSLSLFGRRVIKVENGEEAVHKLAQIKFAVHNNGLLKYEETRQNQLKLQLEDAKSKRMPFADYLLELNFDNIKSLWISKSKP